MVLLQLIATYPNISSRPPWSPHYCPSDDKVSSPDFSFHGSWIHLFRCHAPHSQVPNALDVMTRLSLVSLTMTEVPFQWAAKVFYQRMSDLNTLFKRMWWYLPFATLNSEMMRCKMISCLTTVHACCNVPIKDSSSSRVHAFFLSHSCTKVFSRSSFSFGNWRTCFTVSISIPRNVITVLGPSCFSWASDAHFLAHFGHRIQVVRTHCLKKQKVPNNHCTVLSLTVSFKTKTNINDKQANIPDFCLCYP